MTAVYEWYDQAGELLYIGVSDDVVGRAARHEAAKAWWEEVARRRSPLPKNWPDIRQLVLDRDDHLCRLRRKGCTIKATEVHHTAGHDNHNPEYLIAVCANCHGSVTGREANQIKQQKYDRRRPQPKHPGLIQ